MAPVTDEFPLEVPDRPELVSQRREGDVVWLTIERPEVLNCLSFPTLRRFRSLLEDLAQDLSIRCVLITGSGEKAFCAGADLKERRTMPAELVPIFVRNIRALMDDVAGLPQDVEPLGPRVGDGDDAGILGEAVWLLTRDPGGIVTAIAQRRVDAGEVLPLRDGLDDGDRAEFHRLAPPMVTGACS